MLRRVRILLFNNSNGQLHLRSRLSTLVKNDRRTSQYNNNESQRVENDKDFLKHKKVGITEFLRGHPMVTATFRERFSDFHVHEIDPNGTRIQLTDLNPPTPNTIAITSAQDDDDDAKAIQTTKNKNENKKPVYTHCTLYKQSLALSQVIHSLTKDLRIPSNTIRWAGTKDKWAKTTQRISIAHVDAQRLIEFSNLNRNIKLGNFVYSPCPLDLGELKGNHFTILLKNIKLLNPSSSSRLSSAAAASLAFEEGMETLKEIGFINYFGVQRFGNYGIRPYMIGNAVLQMDWNKVFDLVLSPKPNDSDEMVRAKALWFSLRDPVKIIKLLEPLSPQNYQRSLEAHLFEGLSRHYKDGLGNLHAAYIFIPDTHRLMYVPSFTSFLWNHIASFRVRKFGLTPIPGDLVRAEPSYISTLSSNDQLNQEQQKVQVSLNPCSFDNGSCDGIELDEVYSPSSSNMQVKVLTDEDLGTGHYWSVYDVLLPVPGKQGSRYANPIVQDFFEKLLHEQGLSADCFEKYTPKSVVPRGSYRPLIVRPDDLKYSIIPYGEADVDNFDTLIPSDWDLLQARLRMGDCGGVDISDQNYLSRMQEKKKYGRGKSRTAAGFPKDKVCAVIEFSLNTSSYATMALREVLK